MEFAGNATKRGQPNVPAERSSRRSVHVGSTAPTLCERGAKRPSRATADCIVRRSTARYQSSRKPVAPLWEYWSVAELITHTNKTSNPVETTSPTNNLIFILKKVKHIIRKKSTLSDDDGDGRSFADILSTHILTGIHDISAYTYFVNNLGF